MQRAEHLLSEPNSRCLLIPELGVSAATLARLEPSHFLAMNHQLATGIAALKLVGPRQPNFAIRLLEQWPLSLIVVGAMGPVANWRTGFAAYGRQYTHTIQRSQVSLKQMV